MSSAFSSVSVLSGQSSLTEQRRSVDRLPSARPIIAGCCRALCLCHPVFWNHPCPSPIRPVRPSSPTSPSSSPLSRFPSSSIEINISTIVRARASLPFYRTNACARARLSLSLSLSLSLFLSLIFAEEIPRHILSYRAKLCQFQV